MCGEYGIGQSPQVGLEQTGGHVDVRPARVVGGGRLPAVQGGSQRRHSGRVTRHAVHPYCAEAVRLEVEENSVINVQLLGGPLRLFTALILSEVYD